jgi:hypothetical protein
LKHNQIHEYLVLLNPNFYEFDGVCFGTTNGIYFSSFIYNSRIFKMKQIPKKNIDLVQGINQSKE